MRKIKRLLKIMLFVAIFIVFYSFSYTLYENIKVNKTIDEFKSRGILQEERLIIDERNYLKRYYEVPRETTAELNDKKNVFYDEEKNQLGMAGDIFVTRQSPFPTKKVFHTLLSFYAGGHAAIINYNSNGKPYYAEALGFPANGESIFDYIFHKGNAENDLHSTVYNNPYNYWQETSRGNYYYNQFYRTRYMGLRAVNHFVGTDKEELYDDYVNEAVDLIVEKASNQRLYNFLFFFNKRYKYYCFDLVARTYEEAYERIYNDKPDYESKGFAKKMNDDGFVSTAMDIILSKDTFMTFYVEINEENINGVLTLVQSIYYLADVN